MPQTTSGKREDKESYKAQISIPRRTRAGRAQSGDAEDIHRDIYQLEIADEQ